MSKYKRTIKGIEIDVYDILKCYNITNPALQHAIKKLLMPGDRGHKNIEQDLKEAKESIDRAIELEKESNTIRGYHPDIVISDFDIDEQIKHYFSNCKEIFYKGAVLIISGINYDPLKSHIDSIELSYVDRCYPDLTLNRSEFKNLGFFK